MPSKSKTITKNKLDFNLVPDLKRASTIIGLDEKAKKSLSKLPQTFDRATGSMHFCWALLNSDAVKARDKGDGKIQAAYLRASLAEFVSMEETLPRDLSSFGIKANPIKIYVSSNPLLHIIRELRNLEIHLHTCQLSPFKIQMLFAGQGFEHEIWVTQDLTDAEFKSLDNAEHYDDPDITKLLTWFNAAQKEWGVHDLVFRAVTAYSENIIKQYSL